MTEGSSADDAKDEGAETEVDDIAARLAEYRRLLREGSPAGSSDDDAFETGEEGEADLQEAVTDEAGDEPSSERPEELADEARLLKERIERLDETLARLSSMLPLLRGERSEEEEES